MPSTTASRYAVGPRWAGYLAAAFSLEYVIAKLVMAGREQLGVPGHPAPPEAYVGFTGDVVAAQLGNAGVGLLSLLLALAFAHRWGRRVPPALLAAGALGAVIAGIAGAAVVAGGLTGLHDDHGQWGVDSLALGIVPLGAWGVLSLAALRAARAHGIPPGLRRLAGRTAGVARAATRPGRRAAPAAAAACAVYGALKLHWALGGDLLLRETPLPAASLRAMLAREPTEVASHWASVALAIVGIALAVATVRAAQRLPRALTVGLPALLGVLMGLRAGWGFVSDVAVLTGAGDGVRYTAWWDLALWSPFFAVWGAAWLLVARATRGRGLRQRRSPGRGRPGLRAARVGGDRVRLG